jgi:ABC-type Zn uptake system ZnuABC Zn-binding protein ZnuA
MAENICHALCDLYPHREAVFQENLAQLLQQLSQLQSYGEEALSSLSCRELITFHDGFAYFAHSFDLEILEAVEEESGSEASAKELKALISMVNEHNLPAIFTEINGSTSAAHVISRETGAAVFALDMAMASDDYFQSMYRDIDTIKEALG